MRNLFKLLPLILLWGCASYHYDIASPDGGDRSVRKDADLIVSADPLKLRFRQVESRCVVILDNPTPDPLTLDGSASAIVDPSGQSRALPTQLIASGSYIKLILPPLMEVDPRGPRLNLGLGVLVDAQTERQVSYLDVGATQDTWDWPGEGTVRLILSIKSSTPGATAAGTRHEIVIHKIKN